MKKPNLFIVGQQKSGTTALHSFLNEHPDIYMSKVKEPHFFCRDFHEESDSYYGSQLYYPFRDEDSYLKLFSKATSEKIIGESSTQYLYSKVAAREIHKFNPDAKIIIMLREPASFLYSYHNHLMTETMESEKDFSKALLLEALRKQGKHIGNRIMSPSLLYYSEIGNYYKQVKRLYETFNSSQIKVIIFEDFQGNNDKFYRETLDFLGVNSNFSANYRSVHARKKVRFEILNYIVHNPTLLKISGRIFSPAFNGIIRTKIVERFLLKQDFKNPIPSEIHDRLMRTFKQEVLEISQLIEIDLFNKWGYEQL